MNEGTHMYCTKCGAPNEEGVRFCTSCGAPLNNKAMQNNASNTVQLRQPPVTAPTQSSSSPTSPKSSSKKTIAIVAGIAAALAIGGGAGCYFGIYMPPQEQAAKEEATNKAAHSMHSVIINVKGDGWNTADGSSKLPVKVSGTDVDGDEVEEVAYVDSNGKGLKLTQGTYKLKIQGSPLGSDGSLWNVPDTIEQIELKSDLKNRENLDLRSQALLQLGDKVNAVDITDSQTAAAENLAEKGGCNTKSEAKALATAVKSARDAAVSAKQAEDAAEAQKQAEQEAETAKQQAEQAQSSSSSSTSSDSSPFWGAFAMASKNYDTSKKKADDLRNSGFPNAQVVCTTDWTNLNKETWYSVTVGKFSSKSDADQAVSKLKSQGVSDAYSRYSGDHK